MPYSAGAESRRTRGRGQVAYRDLAGHTVSLGLYRMPLRNSAVSV